MDITRKSAITGITRTINLPITKKQLDMYNSGIPAKEAFPELTEDEREFFITGVTSEEWDSVYT